MCLFLTTVLVLLSVTAFTIVTPLDDDTETSLQVVGGRAAIGRFPRPHQFRRLRRIDNSHTVIVTIVTRNTLHVVDELQVLQFDDRVLARHFGDVVAVGKVDLGQAELVDLGRRLLELLGAGARHGVARGDDGHLLLVLREEGGAVHVEVTVVARLRISETAPDQNQRNDRT